MFSNAFNSIRDFEVIELFGSPPGDGFRTPRAVLRQIERWRTQAFALRCIEIAGANNSHEVERLLVPHHGRLASTDRLPRLFYRMVRFGQPSVSRVLQQPNSIAYSWVRAAVDRHRATIAALDEPIWRLLDPTPLSLVEFLRLEDNAIGASVMETPWLRYRVGIPSWLVEIPRTSEHDHQPSHYCVRRGSESSRLGLQETLLAVRKAELSGELLPYYLNLLEALDRCAAPDQSPDFALFQPELATFLASCFGRVHVAYSELESLTKEIELRRIAEAPLALRRAKLQAVPTA